MGNILSVEKVEKYYGNNGNVTKAVDNISFNVSEGEFLGIMGPSGSGKTSLLNCISTIDTVTTGKILLEDKDITRVKSRELEGIRQNKIGFIFQEFNLIDTLNCHDNIALSLSIKGEKQELIEGKVKSAAEQLGISDILSKYPNEVSGGEKQRVAAARAIVTEPKLILADEPTGALDSKASRKLLEKLECLNAGSMTTILMVTHDAFTASYAHRILFLKDGKIFTELVRGDDSRKDFFKRIIEVITLMGGDGADVI